jgi:hypothetical protein
VEKPYLEGATLERGLEVVRLGCKNDFVHVKVVGAANDRAVRKLLGVMDSVIAVRFGQHDITRRKCKSKLTWRGRTSSLHRGSHLGGRGMEIGG